jgi:hypothetical protein
MATTTNYGWSTPDDTALVSQGAAAIRTLGSSADTTVKALSPGTTAGDVDYYTSSTAKARLGIGSTGQVLTVSGGVPSWATASSGGMTLISTTTLTGASVTVSSIPATYNDLVINIVNFIPASDGSRIQLRMNADASANRHATGASGAFGATLFDFFENQDNAVSQSLWRLEIPNYANTTTWKLATMYGVANNSTTSTNFAAIRNAMGIYNQTGAISSLEFLTNSGNFTSGSILLYGVK